MNGLLIKLNKLSLKKTAFLQAFGLVSYCALVGLIFWKGEELFGRMNNYVGPVLLLSLLSVSVLICALIVLGYPFILFWEDKKPKEAVRLVGYTTGWLAFFVIFIMIGLITF
jgi:hypothetical protein